MKVLSRHLFPVRKRGPVSGQTKLFLVWAFLLSLFAPLPAWSRDYQIRGWQVENGLPDNTITSLAQTPDGYLWVGTSKVLARFDGDNFKSIDLPAASSPEDSSIVGLQAGLQGDLWIVSQSGLITRMFDGEFQVKHQPDGTRPNADAATGRPNVQNWRNWKAVIACDVAGDIWALADHGQLVRFKATGEIVPVSTNDLPAGTIRGVSSDASGRIWLLKGTNVCVLADGHWIFSKDATVPFTSQLLYPSGKDGFFISEVSDSLASVEILRYQSTSNWVAAPESVPTTPAHPQAMAMFAEPDGPLWLGQRWGGICSQLPGGEWTHVQNAGPAARCSVSCMFKDRQNSLWVGTFEEGLIKVYEPPVKVVMLPPEDIDANLHITTVCAAHDGGFWAGTDAGLYHGVYDGTSLITREPDLTGESVYSIQEDSRTNLWIGTQSGLFHRTTNGFEKDFSVPKNSGGILVLYEARNGSIWAAGPHGYLRTSRNGRLGDAFETITGSPPNARLCCITEDPHGRVWIGSGNSGLWHVSGKKLVPDGPPGAFFGNNLRTILFDTNNVLWIGTWANGLFRWGDKKLKHYTTEDGLPDDVILGLATDTLGNLWMISHDGIFGISRRQLASFSSGRSPPLLGQHLRLDEELRICSGAGQPVMSTFGTNGWIWAATMLGVTGYNPNILASTKAETEGHIESLKADGTIIQPSVGGFRVPSDTRHFEFQYSVPELGTPENLHFRHRLDGLDSKWIDAGSARSAVYSQLPPGNYKFRVMVGGTDGVWREIKPPASLQVVPQIWQTIWFRILGITAVILAIAGIGIWNERRKIRHRMERLEARQVVERMRHRIARDLHDELGSTITGILQQGDMSLRVEPEPQQLRATVEDMSGRLRKLSVTLDEIVWTMNSRNDTLPNLAGYISNHAQEFLRHSGIRCRLDVARDLPETAVDSQTRHNLFMAVKEAIHNAARHSGATEIMVRIHFQDAGLRISVEDNGHGFDLSAVTLGQGLTNMKERLEAVHGLAEFSARPDCGSTVTFSVNLNDLATAA